QLHWNGRIPLRRLEDERITRCQRWAGLPQWNHRWEVERSNTCYNAEGLAHRVGIDASSYLIGVLTFQLVRRTERKFQDFQTTLNITLSVWKSLSMLKRQDSGKLIHVFIDERNPLHDHAYSLLRIQLCPHLLRLSSVVNDMIDVFGVCYNNLRLWLAQGRGHAGPRLSRRSHRSRAVNRTLNAIHGTRPPRPRVQLTRKRVSAPQVQSGPPQPSSPPPRRI